MRETRGWNNPLLASQIQRGTKEVNENSRFDTGIGDLGLIHFDRLAVDLVLFDWQDAGR